MNVNLPPAALTRAGDLAADKPHVAELGMCVLAWLARASA